MHSKAFLGKTFMVRRVYLYKQQNLQKHLAAAGTQVYPLNVYLNCILVILSGAEKRSRKKKPE